MQQEAMIETQRTGGERNPGLTWLYGLALKAALATRVVRIRAWALTSQVQQFAFNRATKQISNSKNLQGKGALNIYAVLSH